MYCITSNNVEKFGDGRTALIYDYLYKKTKGGETVWLGNLEDIRYDLGKLLGRPAIKNSVERLIGMGCLTIKRHFGKTEWILNKEALK